MHLLHYHIRSGYLIKAFNDTLTTYTFTFQKTYLVRYQIDSIKDLMIPELVEDGSYYDYDPVQFSRSKDNSMENDDDVGWDNSWRISG